METSGKRTHFPLSSSLFTRPNKNYYHHSNAENLLLLVPLLICQRVREDPGKIPINSLPYFDYRETCVVKRVSQAIDDIFPSLQQIQKTKKMLQSPPAFRRYPGGCILR